MPKQTKVLTKRKKFMEVEIPLIDSKIELIANSLEELKNKTIKLDLTRQLKGKSVEVIAKINIKDGKAFAYPMKIRLMPYFIRRMIRKRISYVEDSIKTPSQDSMLKVKPFLITRKRVSRVIRKTLRNKCRNWVEDYLSERNDEEIFNDILSNKLQRTLSLMLKKTYPLSLCEIRILEIIRPLKSEEIPKKKEKKEIEKFISKEEVIEKPLEEIGKEEIEKAEKEIEKTQKKAEKIEKELDKKKNKKSSKKTKKPEENEKREDSGDNKA